MIDLTELLEERSRVPEAPAGERLPAVERRIVRRRRRRVAGAALGVAALIVAGVALPRGAQRAPETAATVKPAAAVKTGPFAEYADGYRVVAVASAAVSAGKAQTSWKVGSTDIQVFTYCPGLPKDVSGLYGDILVDGSSPVGTGCNPELRQDAFPGALSDLAGELTVGRTATIGFRVTGAQGLGSRRVATPKRGTIYFAVAERVPFAEYPLPPRPSVVRAPEPDGVGTEPGGKILRSDAANPRKTLTTTMVWQWNQDVSFSVLPSTPGMYTVAVDGTTVGVGEIYDYRGGGKGWSCDVGPGGDDCFGQLPTIANGKTVTVTFTAQYATGPWIGEIGTAPAHPKGHG